MTHFSAWETTWTKLKWREFTHPQTHPPFASNSKKWVSGNHLCENRVIGEPHTVSRIGKSHMKTGVFQLWFLKKMIWSKYTLGFVVSWYNLRNCNIWLFLWHLSPQSGPFHQFWSFLLILFCKTTQKKIWSKYTLGIVVSWYNLKNCNIWLFLWHLSPQSGPFYQFWSFLLILFSKTTQKKSKHYSGRAFLEVFGKCVGLGLSSSIQRPQKC